MLPNGSDPHTALAERINTLIDTDFSGLIHILYRLDVSEERVKQVLRTNPGADAGMLIARLVVERLILREKTRQQFRPNSGIPDDEKW